MSSAQLDPTGAEDMNADFDHRVENTWSSICGGNDDLVGL
jgi:hypothetical protein